VPADSTPAQDDRYTIVVASFTSPERAERAVEELTNAGYRARAVERDWRPPRGRLVQVNVGDYPSVSDAQRDLEQIRELPGGYRDARIVNH
jgi:cell division septation protein DedD